MSLAATLLTRTSSLLAHSASLEDTLSALTFTLGRLASLDRVRISIEDPHTGLSLSSTHSENSPTPSRFVFTRDLEHAGLRYGQLEILSSQSPLRAIELYLLATTLENLLTQFAVAQSHARRNSQLRASLHLLREELLSRKLLARIQALLDSSGYGHLSASQVLAEESRAGLVSLTTAASRFLRRYHRTLHQEAA